MKGVLRCRTLGLPAIRVLYEVVVDPTFMYEAGRRRLSVVFEIKCLIIMKRVT